MKTLTEHRRDTQTVSPPPTVRGTRRGNRFLIGLVVVLVAALAGLGAWVINDWSSTSDTAVTDEIAQLLDDYHDAWNTWDGDAYLELMTGDGVHRTAGGTSTAAQQARLIDGLERYDWHVEAIGGPIMTGDGPWYVAQANLLTATSYPDGHPGMSILTVVDDGGALRIAEHVYIGRY